MSLDVALAAGAIRARLDGLTADVAIVLGSGLGALGERVEDPVAVPYHEIPGFSVPEVPGHRGELLMGRLGRAAVVVMSGRFHMYEGHSADAAALPVRVASALGATVLVLTNAAGGIRRGLGPGTVMLISDHLNLTGRNPLVGPARDGEARFPDMSAVYDAGLRARARQAAERLGVAVEEGVYAGVLGPSYETPAEIRMLERLGADAVGMSTVMEAIAGRALGMRCLGISLVTNLAAGLSPVPLSHDDVMEQAGRGARAVAQLVEAVVGDASF